MSPGHFLSMGIDAAALAALVACKYISLSAGKGTETFNSQTNVVLWIGMLAGAGLILIRFTSDAAWWTGHL